MKHILLFFGFTSILLSMKIQISSTLTNIDGSNIINANIYCTDNGTISANDGTFSISCDENDILHITHIGYEKYSIKSSLINDEVLLNKNDIVLDEIKIFGGINENILDTRIKLINSEKISSKNHNHLEDIIIDSPNLHFSGGTSRARYFQIRGIGELSQFSGEGAPHFYIGILLDDIDFSGISGISLLSDVKQVEIFKGPQSSSYGPNAMGGIINITSNDPVDRSFKTSLSLSNYNTNKITLSYSKKINDKISSNISFVKYYTDGMMKNIYTKTNDTNLQDEYLIKSKLYFKINPTVNIKLTSYYINLDNKYNAWTPDNNGFISYSDYQGFDKQITKAFSLRTNILFSNFTLTSISTYSNNEMIYSYDGDWGNIEYWDISWYNFKDVTHRDRKSYSQELKFTFNNISSGIYASFLEEQDHRDGYFFAGDGIIDSKFKIKNIAIYIQSNTKINLKSYLKVSFRYDTYKTDQNLSYSLYNWNYYSWNDYGTYLFTEKDNNIGGTISLIYNKNSFLSFFISHAIGYKTSGINQSPNFPNNRIYDTETSNNTEIGYKFKDSTLSLDFTSFYVHRNNPQLRLFMQLDLNNPLSFDYATFNGSDSYSSGFELDLSINYKKINIYNSLSLLNTHIGTFLFDEDNNGELESFGSRNSAHSPEKQYIIGFNYYFKNLNNGLSFSLESNYTDEFWFDDQNDHKSNSYNILNTTINYKFKSYLISFWGKNINDIIIPVRGFSFALEPDEVIRDYKSFGMKKTIGITIEYNI